MIKTLLKKQNIFYMIIILLSSTMILFIYNNYFLYKTPILHVINIKTTIETNNTTLEVEYKQHLTGIIKNGKYKGKTLTYDNMTSTSKVYDDNIHIDDDLLVNISENGKQIYEIKSIKRDKYVTILLVIFIDLIIIFAKIKGIKIIVSLMINIVLTALALSTYIKMRIDILLLFLPIVIIFILSSLMISNGKSKKVYSAIISSIVATLTSFLISYLILKYFKNSIFFWNMDYSEILIDYEKIFYLNILLSSLGAIMDISITMSSSLNEIINKTPSINNKNLIKSGKNISKDILGTMTNVMLFTCFTSIIPITLLALKNNTDIISTINNYGQLEMIRVLTSCIAIVLTIPISLFISIFILRRCKK